jgi:ABC-type anion transport system duplicated permease subunit
VSVSHIINASVNKDTQESIVKLPSMISKVIKLNVLINVANMALAFTNFLFVIVLLVGLEKIVLLSSKSKYLFELKSRKKTKKKISISMMSLMMMNLKRKSMMMKRRTKKKRRSQNQSLRRKKSRLKRNKIFSILNTGLKNSLMVRKLRQRRKKNRKSSFLLKS